MTDTQPSERDREVAEEICVYLWQRMEGEGLPTATGILATYRAEIEAAARADERARIVAWLREWPDEPKNATIHWVADALLAEKDRRDAK